MREADPLKGMRADARDFVPGAQPSATSLNQTVTAAQFAAAQQATYASQGMACGFPYGGAMPMMGWPIQPQLQQQPPQPPPPQTASPQTYGDGRFVGQIKSYNPTSGFGFISCAYTYQTYGRDVFVHKSQIGNLSVGDQVAFRCEVNKTGMPQAKDLTIVGASSESFPAVKGKGKGKGGNRDGGKGGGKDTARDGGKGRKGKNKDTGKGAAKDGAKDVAGKKQNETESATKSGANGGEGGDTTAEANA